MSHSHEYETSEGSNGATEVSLHASSQLLQAIDQMMQVEQPSDMTAGYFANMAEVLKDQGQDLAGLIATGAALGSIRENHYLRGTLMDSVINSELADDEKVIVETISNDVARLSTQVGNSDEVERYLLESIGSVYSSPQCDSRLRALLASMQAGLVHTENGKQYIASTFQSALYAVTEKPQKV
jgi:hypothetical protein